MMRAVAIVGAICLSAAAAAQVGVTDFLGTGPPADFERAEAPRAFDFPADHGAHPGFRSEWWYFTGNLAAADGRHFGFQLTFFRFALAPGVIERASAWATNQAWMAHLSVTDSAGRRFHAAERLARGALGLAGAEAAPFHVWLGDWEARAAESGGGIYPLRLIARDEDVALDLTLTTAKPLVLQGENGWHRKGPEPGNASYYYAYTRLIAHGQVNIDGAAVDVSGSAWMDREWGSSALGPDLSGWDWCALQLSDGSELMLYRLRHTDGRASAFSKAEVIGPDGERRTYGAGEFAFEPRRWWTSPKTQVRYPVAWSIALAAEDLSLEIEPRLDDQELELTVRYWEGAVTATGRARGGALTAEGYLELAGY
ncbi:MAG: lipocalin-like domain-containing protein [Steroidobacteraceae bacterium]